MNKLKLIAMSLLLGGLGLAGTTSCVDILDDNENPDKPSTINPEVGLPVIVFYSAQTNYDHAEYNIYLSQCLTTTDKSQTGSYGYKSGWELLTMNRHPQWRRHFYDLGENINILLKNAETYKSPNYGLIGRAIRLMSTQLTTDAFGDMPRSEAYLSNSPRYDSQASIYKWMLEEADALIKDFENPELTECPTNRTITIKQDRIYGGDLKKWKGLVYAIKARILLRNIPNVDTSAKTCQAIYDAAAKAIEIWRSDATYGDFFGCEPRYKFDGGSQQQNAPWSVAQPIINSWESRKNMLADAVPSKFMLEECMGVFKKNDEVNGGAFVVNRGWADDPRAILLFTPRTGPASATNTAAKIKLRWLENNIGCGTSFKAANFPDLYSGAYAYDVKAYVPLFTMEELYFIQAEAKYWMGDKVGACQLAKDATRANIERHLAAFQEKNPKVLYPGNVTDKGFQKFDPREVSKEEEFTLSKARWDATVEAFLNNADQEGEKLAPVKGVTNSKTPGNHRWFFNESEFSLSDLMMQKYVAMYMQPEQWTDMRRYHYSNERNKYGIGPNREIVYEGLRRPYNLYAPYWIDGLTEDQKENTWIQRINYDPETEERYNKAELERLGAYKNYKWLQKPMIWAEKEGVRTSLTAE